MGTFRLILVLDVLFRVHLGMLSRTNFGYPCSIGIGRLVHSTDR